jgi:hypothetical protein
MTVLKLSVPHSLPWLHAKPQAQILSSGVLFTFVWSRTQLQSIQTAGTVCFSVEAGRRRTSQHPWRSKEAFSSPLDRPRVLIRSCKTAHDSWRPSKQTVLWRAGHSRQHCRFACVCVSRRTSHLCTQSVVITTENVFLFLHEFHVGYFPVSPLPSPGVERGIIFIL